VAKGLKIEEPVELVDVMPTLLDLSALPPSPGMQGQSMRPLLAKAGGAGGGWKRRPPIAEKQTLGGSDFPSAAVSYAVMDGNWKLIHNVVRPADKPEFELFDFYRDPLDQKNVAAEHPEVVDRLAKMLDGWHQMAAAAKLKPDSELTKGMSREQLEQLRSLGYVK
jgi:arylsulfatase